jgi:hypothetical protein
VPPPPRELRSRGGSFVYCASRRLTPRLCVVGSLALFSRKRHGRQLGSRSRSLNRCRSWLPEEDEERRRIAANEPVCLEDADPSRQAFERRRDSTDARRPSQRPHPLRRIAFEPDLDLERNAVCREARDRAVRKAHSAVAPRNRGRPTGDRTADRHRHARARPRLAGTYVPPRRRGKCRRREHQSGGEDGREHALGTFAR